MIEDLTNEVRTLGSINFEGNIIPLEWFNYLKLDNGKPDTISILILSDIIYWYRPTIIRDELSGRIIGSKKKFKADLLQRSYSHFENLLGFSGKQTREALIRLEKRNILERVFRHINIGGQKIPNVMYIKINPQAISEITNRYENASIKVKTSFPRGKHTLPHKTIYHSSNVNTNTETTTENTINNSLSILSKQANQNLKQINPEFSARAKNNERENEMLKIWNEIVEEKNEITIKLTSKREELLNLRLKSFFKNDISLWKDFCQKIATSKFLMGEVTKFKVQLDWALKEENLVRIMENSYGVGDRLVVDKNTSVEALEEDTISNPIWKKTREELKKQLGERTFKSWISKLHFQTIANNTAHLTVPTNFIKEWIITNYNEDIKRNFNANGANIQQIVIQYNADIKIGPYNEV